MLKLLSTIDGVSEIREIRVDNGFPSLTDYNVEKGEFSTERVAYIKSGWEHDKLKKFIESHPEATIYNTVSHRKISNDRVKINNKDYIDPFGLYVYIDSQVSWSKKDDIDERFYNNKYPEELGLEFYEYILRE